MNAIVFSKDRPAQLDLFLRSADKFAKGLIFNVITKATNDSFGAGYTILQSEHKTAILRAERDFGTDVAGMVDAQEDLTVFFVDDNIFTRPWNWQDSMVNIVRSKEVGTLSLRLGRNIRKCYTMDRCVDRPHFREIYTGQNVVALEWNWRYAQGDWGYPMSLDGHVFRTQMILGKIDEIPFTGPNQLEGQLAMHPILNPKMLCYPVSVLMNVPANRVQNDVPNRCGKVSHIEMHERYMRGERIDLGYFVNYMNVSPHQEVRYQWTKG